MLILRCPPNGGQAPIKHHRLGLTVYESIAQAEEILGQVIKTYNTTDYHSGIANFIPTQVHDGSWEGTAHAWQDTVGRYYAQYPERLNRPPRIKFPPKRVNINADWPDDDYLLVIALSKQKLRRFVSLNSDELAFLLLA